MSGKGRRAHHDERALMFVGTRKGIFVYESDFDREKWKRTGPFIQHQAIRSIAYDYRDQKSVLIATLGDGIHRTRDNGRTWEKVGRGLPSQNVSLVAIGHLSEPAVVWAGVEPAGLAVSRNGGDSFEEIAGFRSAIGADVTGPVTSIIVHLDSPRRLHVSVGGSGIFRTEDGGATWIPASSGFADVTQVVTNPAKAERLYAASGAGVFRSDDEGDNWIDISTGLSSRLSRALVVSPSKPGTLFVVPLKVVPGADPRSEGGLAAYHSGDGGQSWEKRVEGLPGGLATCVHSEALAMDTLDEEGLYLGTESGALFVTRDEGEGWTQIAAGLAPVLSLEVVTEQE